MKKLFTIGLLLLCQLMTNAQSNGYDPVLPGHPGQSGWDPTTGALVVTWFTPGQLSDAIQRATNDEMGNSHIEKIRSLTVSGKATNSDMYNLRHLKPYLRVLDLSRTDGITEVSWSVFSQDTVMHTILLPASIETIGNAAFKGSTQLESFTIYATTPPALPKSAGDNPFMDTPATLTVYVPAESLPLYAEAEGWKDMELMPITQGVHTLTVNMPAGANMQQYKDMFLELANVKTGQTQRFVITNRTQYTYHNLIEGTLYNVYIRNAHGDVLATIHNVEIAKADVQVAFSDLKHLRDLTLRLLAPDGTELPALEEASGGSITWTDLAGNFLAKGATLTAQVEGSKTIARVKLGETLGTQYLQPADTTITVGESTIITCQLSLFPTSSLSGTVTASADGQPIRAANIAVTQQLNGLYPVTLTTTSDAHGNWTLSAYDAPTTVTMQATGYVPQTFTLKSLPYGGKLEGALRDLVGTTISLDLSYRPAVREGETPDSNADYNGYQNLSYSVYDETHALELTNIQQQGGYLVLQDQELAEGTRLRVTATSPKGDITPATATCTVGADGTATATLPLVQLGQLKATFSQTDNRAVVGMLYDADGQLLSRGHYTTANATPAEGETAAPTLWIGNLPDGQYTLVTMGESTLFNGVNSLASLTDMGLEESRDYLSNRVEIVAGRIDSLYNQTVPMMDESLFYWTTENTHFTANKSSLTIGGYVTLRTEVDFKSGFDTKDIQLHYDLPEGCQLVEGTVMAGNQLAQYALEGQRLTVPLTNRSDIVRFCVMPTEGGYYEPSASIRFDTGWNDITQPLGSVAFQAETLSISMPDRVSNGRVQVSGTAIAASDVKIFEGDQLIGHTEAGPDGSWSMRCSLNRPYNLSQHYVHAEITTPDGITMQTETQAVTVSHGTVTPVVYATNSGTTGIIKWDFRDYTVTPKHNAWPLGPGILPFTFKVDFYNEDNRMVNDTTLISNVTLYVLLSNDTYVELKAPYNASLHKWVAQADFSIDASPKNIFVDFLQDETIMADRQQMDDEVAEITESIAETRQMVKDIYALPNKKMVLDNQPVFDELEQLLAIEEPDSVTQVRIDTLLSILTDGMNITLDNQADYDELAQLMASLPMRETTTETRTRIETLMERIKNTPQPDLSGLNTQIASINAKKHERRDDILTLFSMVANIDTTSTQKPNGDFSFDIPLKGKVRHYSAKHINAINTDALTAEGYHEVPMTDGNSIYCMMTPNKESLIDTRSNMQYTIVTEDVPAASRANAPIQLRVDSLFDQQIKAEFIENVNDLIHTCIALSDSNFSEQLLKEYVFGRGYLQVGAIQYHASRLLDSGRKNMDEMAESLYKQYKDIYELDKYNNKINIEEAKKALATAKEKRRNSKKHRDDVKSHIETLKIYIDNDRKNNYPEDRIAKLESELNYWQSQLLPRAEEELTQANNQVKEAENTLQNAKENEKLTESLSKENEKSKKAIDAIVKSLPSTYTYGGRQQKWIAKAHELEGTPLGLLLQLYELYFQSLDAYNEIGGWKKTYEAIKRKYPCPEMEIEQKQLENKIIYLAQANGKTAIESSTGGASMIANADFVPHGDTKLSWFLSNCTGVSISYWFNVASSEALRKEMDAAIDALKCEPDPDEEPVYQYMGSYYLHGDPSDPSNKDKNKKRYVSSTNIDFYHDPSGYVYEAVSSNRLEGVRATCYYKETKEDMYGDLYENVVLWNAEEYAQENPLFTDAEGMYRWDVPQGLWQVKYEKEGYETTYSEWLPVPPPQLEVNIGMTQLRQPAVQHVKACTDGIDITFDKYMRPQTLNSSNILVTKNGQAIGGQIELLNTDSGYETPDSAYASKVRFVPTTALTLTDKVRLTVRRQVESYAGLQMEQDFTQEFDVEQRITAIVADSLLYMAEGDTQMLTVRVLPAEAAKGKQLKAVLLNEDVVRIVNNSPAVTLDQNGNATLEVFAAGLGSSAIKFCLADDDDLQATTLVHVKDSANMFVYMPKASRMSGTEVYRGAEIKLTCQTAGATILYTLDGSCPCDPQSPSVLTYNAPIVATGTELVIRAMAVANGMAESDVAEFRYTVIDNIVLVEPVVTKGTADPIPVAYYTLDGRRIEHPIVGLNIVRYADGTTRKVVVK